MQTHAPGDEEVAHGLACARVRPARVARPLRGRDVGEAQLLSQHLERRFRGLAQRAVLATGVLERCLVVDCAHLRERLGSNKRKGRFKPLCRRTAPSARHAGMLPF